MTETIISQLLTCGIISKAEFDPQFNVTFLTTKRIDETGNPIKLLLDDSSDRVISVVGRMICFTKTIDNQPSLLLHALWFMNKANEHIIENESVGFWSMNSENRHFLYTASMPCDSSTETLAAFCEVAIQTYVETRQHLVKLKQNE